MLYLAFFEQDASDVFPGLPRLRLCANLSFVKTECRGATGQKTGLRGPWTIVEHNLIFSSILD